MSWKNFYRRCSLCRIHCSITPGWRTNKLFNIWLSRCSNFNRKFNFIWLRGISTSAEGSALALVSWTAIEQDPIWRAKRMIQHNLQLLQGLSILTTKILQVVLWIQVVERLEVVQEIGLLNRTMLQVFLGPTWQLRVLGALLVQMVKKVLVQLQA